VPLARAAPLLRQDAVVREALADLGQDGGLALLVRLGDEIVLALAADFEARIPEVGGHDRRSGISGGNGGF
jgi:hypothetical protein